MSRRDCCLFRHPEAPEVLADQVDGKAGGYLCWKLGIAKDGSIYFSDTSNYGSVTAGPHGRC